MRARKRQLLFLLAFCMIKIRFIRGTIFLFLSLIFFGVAIINGIIAVILYYG